jgi:hypothetical protein
MYTRSLYAEDSPVLAENANPPETEFEARDEDSTGD